MKQTLPMLHPKQTLLALLFLAPLFLSAQLSGSYTINPTASASSTNYRDFASAVSDMLSGTRSDGGTAQGSGVSGPVTFTVYDTVYTSVSLEITAISGASSTNRITFRSAGSDSARCVLKNASSSVNTADYVLYLNGADYITFSRIGFERSGSNTYATVVQIGNDADNNRFTGCQMRGRKMPSSSSLGFNYAVGSCIYISGNADNTLISGNRLLYGYNGIYCASSCTSNTISGNTIDTSGSSGIYMSGQSALRITDNRLRMGDFGPNQGHYTSYAMRIETSPSMLIAGNRIQMLAVNAQVVRAVILASTTSSSGSPALVYNNWIQNSGGTGDCTGLAVYACNYLNFYYNNVLINSSSSTGSAYYHYPQYTNSYIRLMNNNLINKGAGYAINVPGTNTADLDSVDYNNLYSSGTNLGQWAGNNYTSLSGWRTGSGKDANSLNLDPGYSSNSDLHVSSIGLNGKAFRMAWVSRDIDGELRDTSSPDIGADEFFPVSRDIGITSLDSPMVYCAGTHAVKVRFQNFGIDTIRSARIYWQVNSATQSSYNWSGTLAPGATSASVSVGNFSFASNTAYAFRVWTGNPNNLSDGKPVNDTLRLTRMAGLTGTYTIGDTAGTDFKSFNDAINGLSARGICGAVTFQVRPGVYNEQITFLQLPGMGASNPIVFRNSGSDSTRVVIRLASTTATGNNNAALQLRGADYVSFRGITFERTGSNTIGHVIHILNGSHNNSFSHCQMIGLRSTTANTNAYNIWSDQGQDNNNRFINNYIRFGTAGILYSGLGTGRERGTVIEGNVFDSCYNQGVSLRFNDGLSIRRNTFRNLIFMNAGYAHLSVADSDSSSRISANHFTGNNASAAISIRKSSGANTSQNLLIDNNFIRMNNGTGILLADSLVYAGIHFNSIYMGGTSSSNAGIYNGSLSNLFISMKNNIVYMQAGDALYVGSPASVSASDYNNLISKGTQLAYWGGGCNDLTALRSRSGKDLNSVSVNPYFVSAGNGDLHIINPNLKGSGSPVSGISTDIDGESRNSNNPDMGADEFRLTARDAGILTLYKPFGSACVDIHPVMAVIRNYGNDTLRSATIEWTAAGVAQSAYNWSGSLATNENDTVIIGSFNFLAQASPRFVIWTTLPNAQSDGFVFNDTLDVVRGLRPLPVANAGPDQTICAGSSVTIGPNAATGVSYVWNDLGFQTQVGSTARLTVSPGARTEYELIVSNTTYGCSKRDTVVVNVNPVPVANAGADRSICYGNSTRIGAQNQSGFSYAWSSQPAGFTSSVSDPLVGPLQTTYYFLEKTHTGSSCKDRDTVRVEVFLNPAPRISGSSTVCPGSSATYSSPLVSGSSYSWRLSGAQILSGQNSNSVDVRWGGSGSGRVELIEINQNACADTAIFNVTVSAEPLVSFQAASVCHGETTAFSNTSSGAVSYSWRFGDGAVSGLTQPMHQYQQPGTYTVMLTGSNAASCSDTAVADITVNALPLAGFRYQKNQQLLFSFTDTSAVAGGNIVAWEWSFGDGANSALQNPTHEYASPATYTVELCVTSDSGCRSCSIRTIAATGLSGAAHLAGIRVFPNPGQGVFRIESEERIYKAKVYSLNAQLIQELEPGSETMILNLTEAAGTVYLLSIQTAGGHYVLRLLKQP